MMNNNKILTVSYGTFSCTLEGFDDSFGTMKAIAEYFRDLASDDRYFGAEPPQPDAEMLARIAQKEVSRRVQAHERDGKIVLSALEDGTALAAPAAAAEPKTSTVQIDAPQDTPVDVQDDIQEPDTGEEHQVSKTPTAKEPEVVEEIAEIAQEPDFDIADLDLGDVDPVETVTVQTDTLDDVAEEPAAAAFTEDENDIVPGQRDADVEAFFDQAQAPQEASDQDDDILDAASAPVPSTESIAAKLQRIRAVVAHHDDEDEDDDFSEDEHADGSAASAAQVVSSDPIVPADPAHDVVADARRDIEDALQADESADLHPAQADNEGVADEEIDDIADILRRLESDAAAPAITAAAPARVKPQPAAAPIATAPAASTLATETVQEDTIKDAAVEDDGIALENVFEDDTLVAAPTETAAVVNDVVASKGVQVQTTMVDAPAKPPKGPRARVIKVKRADLEAAIESGDLEEYDDEDDQAPDATLSLDDMAPARNADSSLSAEDEDELARELAALEADMESAPEPSETFEIEEADADLLENNRFEEAANDTSEETIAAALAELEQVPQPAPANESLRQKLPAIDEDQDADISRLLAEADSQMDEPESATRRDAFAHLRAAVAAKKADQALGSDEIGKTDDAYRNDLADVVRPRRPTSSEARTKRPGEGRPAPLKLVAEQRIDVAETTKPAGPVSPRRVAKAAPAAETADSSFVDFATEMGATKLPDLLEAAAAYMSFVEGRENFSRPQLMSKVRQAGPDGFNREDTLRSFGKLLREGKIEKIKPGQFSASDEIGFHPSRRAAG